MSTQFKFKPRDFWDGWNLEHFTNPENLKRVERMAELANAALAAHLANCERVYSNANKFWGPERDSKDTRTALLFNVEPLKREPCVHEPDSAFFNGGVSYTGNCKHCQVKLRVAWEPCE